jgi:DinB family protein
MDQDVWAEKGRYARRNIKASLELFRALRHANLDLFKSLTPAVWKLAGVHAERGVETLWDIAEHYAGHDINHLQQIRAILATTVPRARVTRARRPSARRRR